MKLSSGKIIGLVVAALVVIAAGVAVWRTDPGDSSTKAAATGTVYTCSMHPQVRLPRPGKCPICSMPLIPTKTAAPAPTAAAAKGADVFTCSMHPQIRLPAAGKCPLCSMALIPTRAASPSGTNGNARLELSDAALAMAAVETAPITRRPLTHEIRAVGKVQYNETGLAIINTRVDGYVERLHVDFTGVEVRAGDHLVDIYSPDLVVAQQELLIALENRANTNLIASVRKKLELWGLTAAQIDDLVKEKKVSDRVTLYSPIKGTVTEKMIFKKSAVKAGDMLYRLANLDSVWVYLDIYESELAWVQYGQTVEVVTEAYPNEAFPGKIWFINPVLNEETRTVKVVINISNLEQKLKPGMFVSAVVRIQVLADGRPAPTGVAGKFTCPMHPLVLQSLGGACPVCQMDLVRIPSPANAFSCPMHPAVAQPTAGKCPLCNMALKQPDPALAAKPGETNFLVLAVPVSAVLDSGLRKLAFIERARGEYEPVELRVGPRTGGFYPVLGGLQEGDRVAVRGNFLLDSQLQIQGLPSLLYAEGQPGTIGHHHHGAATPPPAPSPPPSGSKTNAPATGHEGHANPPISKEHKH
ncbi:hypothetical protein LBMAG56_19570 [Verrucomicrobiota bacterium]|nr:hypothetical protein LBMAG56_19570 [Verrucomicrobiota bacterium]